MTDKKPYLAKLKSRGLDGTGVTENIARQLVLAKGRRYMALVEVEVHTIHDNPEQMIADLAVEQFWPVVDDSSLDEHLREITAALYARRGSADGDEELDLDGPAPKVSDVLKAGARHRPHPYITSGLSVDDDAACDVCGLREDAAQHQRAAGPADDPDASDDAWEYDTPDGPRHNHGPDVDCGTGCPVTDTANALLEPEPEPAA